MPEIEIARTGRFTDASGISKEFTPDFLEEVANSYNPELFKAPLIITHDTKGVADDKLANSELAFGAPSKLKVVGGKLKALFDKVSPKIEDHFRNGELLSISPSFYPPTNRNNPTLQADGGKGRWTLRHIAALGITSPSIKNLKTPEFSETGYDPHEHTLDFSFPVDVKQSGEVLEFSLATRSLTNILGSLREWIVEKHGRDEADKVVSSFEVDNISMSDRYDAAEQKEIYRRLEAIENSLTQPEGVRGSPMYSEETNEAEDEENNYMEKTTMKTMKKGKHPDEFPKDENGTSEEVDKDLEDVIDDDEDEEDEGTSVPPKKSKKKQKAMNLSEQVTEQVSDFAAELAEERQARKLLELQIQNEQRKTEQERQNRKFDRITNFCDGLVSDGILDAAQYGDRILEYGEDESQLDLPTFMMSLDDEQLSFMESFLSDQPQRVDFGEFATDENSPGSRQNALDFSAVPGAEVSQSSIEEYEEILQYCEGNSLDPNNDADFNKAALAVLK